MLINSYKIYLELPRQDKFCEAIDVEKVNIGNIVWPGTNLKAGTNQMLILLTWNFSMIALNSTCLPASNLETTSKY